MRRAVMLTRIAGPYLVDLIVWFYFQQRRLRWRVRGAVLRWETDIAAPWPRGAARVPSKASR